MQDLGPVLAFAAQLVAAETPASLFDAIDRGLRPLLLHDSINASFNFDRKGHPHTVWSTAPQPPRTAEWAARFTAMNPGLAYLRRNVGRTVLCMDEVIPPDELEAHPFYQTFAKPAGWDHVLGLFVWQDDHIVGYIAVNRRAHQGAFTTEERALARALHPLVAAAHGRIAAARRDDDLQHVQEALLRALPLALIAWTPRDRRVLFHNRAAIEAIARWRGEGARKRPRVLKAPWLPASIVAASEAISRPSVEVNCPRGRLRAVVSRAASPRTRTPRSHFAKDVVFIVLHEAGDARTPSDAWLRVASKLSTAEREVAKLAARGMSNAKIAAALGKSPLTVKTQLEAVFRKAAVDGRVELAALFALRRSA